MSAPLLSDSVASPNRLPLLLLLGTLALSTTLNAYLLVAESMVAAGPPPQPAATTAHADLARTRRLLAACRGESAAPETASTRASTKASTKASSEAPSSTITTFSDR